MENKIKVTFVHPITQKEITVEITDTMTPSRVVERLIEANFLKAGEYTLASRDGDLLTSDLGLGQQNITTNSTLRIVPATQAGAQ